MKSTPSQIKEQLKLFKKIMKEFKKGELMKGIRPPKQVTDEKEAKKIAIKAAKSLFL